MKGGLISMNDVVCFLLVEFLREKIGESAEVRSIKTETELKIKIKGAEIEHDHLEEWLRKDFQHYGIRSLPYGFLAHNQDLSELFVVTISANKEFTSKFPLPSFVTVKEMS